jgi:hypothetical protein
MQQGEGKGVVRVERGVGRSKGLGPRQREGQSRGRGGLEIGGFD